MSSIHELLKQVYPLKLRMELFNAIWTGWRADIKEKSQRRAELEEQLKNARKETAKKVIDRVEELGVFDFEAYEEMDFRRYIIAEMALDNILREYGE